MSSKICPFCHITTGRGKVVAKFKHCYALLSDPWRVPGHLLIIPNRHVTKFSELKASEIKELMEKVSVYQDKILKYAPGTMIRQNYMPFVKDDRLKVSHLHVHIVPRTLNDKLKTVDDNLGFLDPSKKQLSDWARKLQ